MQGNIWQKKNCQRSKSWNSQKFAEVFSFDQKADMILRKPVSKNILYIILGKFLIIFLDCQTQHD